MDWIAVSDKSPEKGTKVQILCSLVTEGVYEPADGIDWYQLPDAPTNATITHWAEINDE